MRKHLVLATLIGFCALSITACQRGENKPAAPAGGATAEQTTPANPGSESLTTASGDMQTEQPANNGTPELAAGSSNNAAPAGQDLTQSQNADNSQPAAGGNVMSPSGTTDTGTSTPTAPVDQNGAAMQGATPPSSTSPIPSDPNAGTNTGNSDNTTPGTGTPGTGDNMGNKSDSNTDTGSSMSPDTQK